VRAYATNSASTAYGNEISFTTSPVVVPTLTTTAAIAITLTTATAGGNITADGGGAVTARGTCWAITANPTVANSKTSDATGTAVFTSNLTGLLPGTTYHIRAYATNSAGTGYGNQLSFTTVHETSTLTDNDGNTYNTVKIGNQWWMAENLKTTTFNNNNPIPNVTASTGIGSWSVLTTGAYCWYLNDIANKPIYGAIYNWFAVNAGNLCPTGWHVPTDAEFITLEEYLGIPADTVGLWGWRGTISQAGNKMKNTTGWAAGQNGTNTSGFSALPGGYRYGVDGSFEALSFWSNWWTGTAVDVGTAYYRRLDGTNSRVYRFGVLKQGGKYVRCMQN